MKKGRLATGVSSAGVVTAVYTVSGDAGVGLINIRCVNTNSADAILRLAITPNGTAPTTADYIEYGLIDKDGGVVERTGLVLSPGEVIWIYSNYGAVSIRVDGIER